MTAPTDQITDFAKRGQEAVTSTFNSALNSWTETVESYTGKIADFDYAPLQVNTADVHALIDSTYAAAEKVLAGQKEFVKTAVDVTAQVINAVGEQAGKTAASVKEAIEKARVGK